MSHAVLSRKSPTLNKVNHRDTGEELYSLVGRYPKYFHNLLFETKKIAEEAKVEAKEVLFTGERPANSKFVDTYLQKESNSDYFVIRES